MLSFSENIFSFNITGEFSKNNIGVMIFCWNMSRRMDTSGSYKFLSLKKEFKFFRCFLVFTYNWGVDFCILYSLMKL